MSKAIALFILVFLLIHPARSQCLIIGADLSYVNTVLDNGGVYRDTLGNITDPYHLFAERGANMVRIRLWHTPENITDHCGNPISTDNLPDVVLAFQRAKALGMMLNLAIHYGDYFNDPGTQKRPEAWMGLSHEILLDSIYTYTVAVLERLETEGVRPDIVAIGNETTNGFIDETTSTNGWSWPGDADKFNVALSAVDDFNLTHNAAVKKAVHFTDNTAAWLAGLFETQNITNFDIIGISFYPFWTDFNNVEQLGSLITQLKNETDKEIMIFETGAPWTTANADDYSNFMNGYGNLDYLVSAQGQKDFLLDLANTVYENEGAGIIYWEPGWISSNLCDRWGQGSSYENVSFFDFTNENAALPAFDVFDFCNTVHAVQEGLDGGTVSIFPNPTKSNIKISGLLKLTEIRVTDTLGREVGQFLSDHTINLGYLPAGVYVVSVWLDDRVISRRIVKE